MRVSPLNFLLVSTENDCSNSNNSLDVSTSNDEVANDYIQISTVKEIFLY